MINTRGACLRAALIAAVCVQVQAFGAGSLRITSLNIRWYGNNGNIKPAPEKRDATLRAFLSDEIKKADVMVFQEIVDVKRLAKEVVGGGMECHSYQHPDSNHQHVVVCHKSEYDFVREANDNNIAAEEVAAEAADPDRARPAVSGLLKRNGQPVAHIIGVHLKAFPKETETRVNQAEAIGERITDFGDDVPVVVIGDFNTYPSTETKKNKDDDALIGEAFQEAGAKMRQVANPAKETYRTAKHKGKFDRIFASSNVKGEIKVAAPCATTATTSQIEKYNSQVSDHCLVAADLKLP